MVDRFGGGVQSTAEEKDLSAVVCGCLDGDRPASAGLITTVTADR